MLKSALLKMKDVFQSSVLKQGYSYAESGHVLTIRLSDGLLKGRVKEHNNHIVDVYVDLRSWPVGVSRCGCSGQKFCAHVASCLFYLQMRENLPPPVADLISITEPKLTIDAPNHEDLTLLPVLDADDLAWYSKIDSVDHEFFSYQLGIVVGEQNVDIMPLVTDLLKRMTYSEVEAFPDEKQVYLPLGKGVRLAIAFGRIKPLLRLLYNYMVDAKDGSAIKMRKYQVALMQEAEKAILATKARWLGTEALILQLKQLTSLSELPISPVPKGLNAVLRDYQHQGFNWLQCLQKNQFSGLLADDMGLGKTIQTLSHLQYEKEQNRMKTASLIIAPTSLMGNWFEEAKRFTPELRVLIFHGAERHAIDFDDYDLILTTYGLMQRDKDRLLTYSFYYLILDEAQFIKNSRTKTRQIVQQLKSAYRLCLTGTPVENHLDELWSLFHFLMPGLLGNARQFRQFFRVPIEKDSNKARKDLLARRIQPFMLRRTKNEVMRELPLKTEIVQKVELVGAQRDVYEVIRLSMESKVREAILRQGLNKSQWVVLDALLRLRQVCCDPRLLSLPEAEIAHGHSAKLDTLMVLLDNLIEEGRFVLVFSQFTSMLTLIEEKLKDRNYAYVKLTGQTEHREKLVQKFQAGEVPIFLISLKAGGTGLNLTQADTVILYDPWWNPAVQDQAIARSYRMGQSQPVFVYKLITSGTVEEKILNIQEHKRQLIDGLLSDETSGHFPLTEVEIRQFFTELK